jgi:hypothetical protein
VVAGSTVDYSKNTHFRDFTTGEGGLLMLRNIYNYLYYEIQLSTSTHSYHQQLKETNSDLD